MGNTSIVPSGILCCACKVLDIFMGIPSESRGFLLYTSSAECLSLKEARFCCSLEGIELECTTVDLQISFKGQRKIKLTASKIFLSQGNM
jgi:hypothetical protein